MPKFLTRVANNYLSQATGSEPFIVIGIYWSSTTGWKYYSSRDIGDVNVDPNIMDIGELRIQRKSEGTSTSGNVSVTFSDTDSIIKTLIDGQVVEKAPANIYLAYVGMQPVDYILIYKGVATGPAQWNEGERKVSFNIEMQVESHELGYSATLADFSDMNPEAQGIPWPMIFGKCAHVPALHIRKHLAGRLQASIRFFKKPSYARNGVISMSLKDNPDVFSFLLNAAPVKGKIYVEDGERFPQHQNIKILIEGVVFQGSFNGTVFTVTRSNLPKYTNIQVAGRVGADPDTANFQVLWIKPQNGKIPPIVNHHCYFNGYISNTGGIEWHNKCIKQEGAKCWFKRKFVNPATGKLRLMSGGDVITSAYGTSKNGMWQDIASSFDDLVQSLKHRNTEPGKHPFGIAYNEIENAEDRANCWWTAFADAEVRIWDVADPEIYIASLVPLSSIKAVFGKRHVEGGDGKTKEIFQQIPTSYYRIQLRANFPVHSEEPGAPDFYPTGIIFDTPLTAYEGQNWQDEVYVSGTSTVGPNPIDITQWIFSKFTNLSIDLASFAQTRYATRNLKANFALFDRRNALKVAEEITKQAKSGLILDSQTVQVAYLASPPSVIATYTENEIEMRSLDVTSTSTNEVITKMVGVWSETYREKHRLSEVREIKSREFEQILQALVKHDRRTRSDSRYTVYRNNIGVYGLKEKQETCFIYNDESAVLAYLHFWGYRASNTWKLVQCKVPLTALRLQIFDGVIIQVTDPFYFGGLRGMRAVVDSVSFSFKDKSCTLGLWTPVRTGTNFVDSLGFWPG